MFRNGSKNAQKLDLGQKIAFGGACGALKVKIRGKQDSEMYISKKFRFFKSVKKTLDTSPTPC